jgi:hypothetical protein
MSLFASNRFFGSDQVSDMREHAGSTAKRSMPFTVIAMVNQ